MNITYFQNSYLILSYNPDTRMACAVWNGFLNSQAFKECTIKCVELMEEMEIVYWLADNRNMKAIRQSSQQWFLENIMPRVLNSTLRRMATLVSHDIFNQMAVEQMLQKANTIEHLALQDFNDEAQALAWLSVPHQVAPASAALDSKP